MEPRIIIPVVLALAVGILTSATSTIIIMTKISEISDKLDAVTAQLSKASQEITSSVTALREQIEKLTNGDVSPEIEASLSKLTDVAQALDDLNPDVPTNPTPST